MITFFKNIVYIPLYNVFVLILNISWIDVGVAAIILTILVKFIIYPLSKKSVVAQIKLKEKEGELASIKEKYKDKQEQALKVMEFYRNNGINPLSSILTVIIQIPVVFSLYYIFFKSGLPTIDQSLLYSFVKPPENISMIFLGFFDISKKSLFFALLAASSTFLQMHFAGSSNISQNTNSSANAEDFSKMLAKQMKYTMPVVVFFVSWQISAVVALYWFVSNVLGIFQDFYIKKTLVNNSK